MVVKLFGLTKKTTYSVKCNTKDDGKFCGRPELDKKEEVFIRKDVDPLFTFKIKNDMYVNDDNRFYYKRINISNEENVLIIGVIMRADINELHLTTDKVIEEIEVNKEEAENEFNNLIKVFNKTINENTNFLKSYCDIHKLNTEECDPEEIARIIYPNETDTKFEIVDNCLRIVTVAITTINTTTPIYTTNPVYTIPSSTWYTGN